MSLEPFEPAPQLLRELFSAAIELAEPERSRFLDEHCAGSPELRDTLERLVRADLSAEAHPLWQLLAFHVEARHLAVEDQPPPCSLGPYRILARIGSGGMGDVFLAERDYDDVRRQVAIKIIRCALLDHEIVRRFLQERQILARLEHPNIARMLDAGRTPDGMPYLVLEFVDGIPIDQYIVAHSLPARARIALFQDICEAVAYAHRNLIVHRDLKPRNILVTAEGCPKLLDFGIAKLLSEASDSEATLAAPMTRAYASPEQLADGNVTTASDIYSLGVILYELIAGEKMSTPRPRLKGDLESVIGMALRHEPERRYSSAGELAEDAVRAAEGYPVRARPDTLAYRARRFIARRRVETAVVVAMAAAIGAACAVAFSQYRSASERFNQAHTIANSFLFDVYDTIADLPGTTNARMVVARRAEQYLNVLSQQRSSDLTLRRDLAASYRKLGDILGRPFAPNLGNTAAALENYRKAAALLEGIASAGRGDAAVFKDWGEICALEGQISIRHGTPQGAVSAGEQSVALLERAAALEPSGPDARIAVVNGRLFLSLAQMELAGAQNEVARLHTAESLAASALAEARQLSAESPGDERLQLLLQKACQYLAYTEADTAERTGERDYFSRAAGHHQEELTVVRSLYGRNPNRYHRNLADALADVSKAFYTLGETRGAEAAARESLRNFSEISVADPENVEAARDVFVARWHLARALAAEHHDVEACAEFEKVLTGYEWVHQRNPEDEAVQVIALARDQLAAYRLAAGYREVAIALYQRNIQMLSESKKVPAKVILALDYGWIGDAMNQGNKRKAKDYYEQAAILWQSLLDSNRLPPRWADKPAEMRRAASR
jgi:tRNA A-37 threonylcarbamoyl transferase component Bud32/tetratricopeptide (TPR) repeat protein